MSVQAGRYSRRFILLSSIALVTLTLLTFGRVAWFDFVLWDDPAWITSNPKLNPPSPAHIVQFWKEWNTGTFGLYIPVTQTAWSLIATMARLDAPDARGVLLSPGGFHCASVLVHSLNVLLVFAVLRRVIANPFAGAIGAALFAVHPLQVESVAWICGLKDLLFAMFGLTALLFLLRAVRNDREAMHRGFYIASVGVFVLAVLSKPTAVTLPLVGGVLLWLVHDLPIKRIVRLMLPWAVLAIPVAILTNQLQHTEGVKTLSLHLRPLLCTDAMAFYIIKTIAPFNLSLDYTRSPTRVFESGVIFFSWIVPMLTLGVISISRSRALWSALFLLVAPLLPLLGMFRFSFQYYSTVSDHYMYLPMLGIALAAAWMLDRWRRTPVWIVSVAIVALLTATSIHLSSVWRDSLSLFTRATELQPDSFLSHHNLGLALLYAGREEEAATHFQIAITINPDFQKSQIELQRLLRTSPASKPTSQAAR